MLSSSPNQLAREIGNYEVISKIAEGGMGAVFKGRHVHTGQMVAIKIIPPETARNPLLLKRFEQEFRAASLIDHPNVVKAIEYCGGTPTPFLVMEFVDGENLGDKVEREGPLTEELAIYLISQVCEGLHRAHKQGLIHRDVKPDNILVTIENIAKLTDLGLVKDVEGEMNLTKTGRGLGTPHFMSPEQFRNAKHADIRCDVYSLGATLYTLVTGQIPFDNTSPLECWMRKTKNDLPTPKSLNPKLSDRVDFAIRRAMAPKPEERTSSCREFMEDLLGQSWKPGQGLSSRPSSDGLPNVETALIWYMVYYDERGQAKTVKGNTETIRANALAGTLGDLSQVLVARAKAGPFAPFRKVAEFRDLVLCGSDSLGGASGTRLNCPHSPTTPEASSNSSPESIFSSDSQSGNYLPGGIANSGTKLGLPPTGRANSKTVVQPISQAQFLQNLPSMSKHKLQSENPMLGKTNPEAVVPLTDADTVKLGTSERPALKVEHTARYKIRTHVWYFKRFWPISVLATSLFLIFVLSMVWILR